MSIPQHILYGAGGTVSCECAARPTAATVCIKSGDGATIIAAGTAAVVSTINTTIDAAASAGTLALSVASATGIVSGAEVLLASPAEKVLVKSVSGTDVNLWRPLLHDHASGVAATGTRVSYTVAAGSATTLFFDGRVEWTLDSVLTHVTSVECTKYPLTRSVAATAVDLYAEAPDLNIMLNNGESTEAILDGAHAEVLERIGGLARVRVYTGSELFERATVFAAMYRLYRRRPGDSSREMYERYKAELEDAIERLQGVAPRDGDQDGTVEENERVSLRSVRIRRG